MFNKCSIHEHSIQQSVLNMQFLQGIYGVHSIYIITNRILIGTFKNSLVISYFNHCHLLYDNQTKIHVDCTVFYFNILFEMCIIKAILCRSTSIFILIAQYPISKLYLTSRFS